MIAAIGAFDGFHLGHQALLHRASSMASRTDAEWGVVTFDRHPDIFFREPGCIDFKSLFAPNEQKLLEKYFSVPKVHRINFTQKIANMSPKDFIDYIGKVCGVDGVVVGEDFRFARDRSGTPQYMLEFCGSMGWSVDVIPMRLAADGLPISSSVIRSAVTSGDMRRAWKLLGYPFFFQSSVIHGYNRGASLGFPTANIKLDPLKVDTRRGVYATLAYCCGSWLIGAANVGLNPTFGDVPKPHFEVNLLGYDGNLYGREITVFMLDHIRDEIKFESAEDLKAQVANDTAAIKKLSSEALGTYSDLWVKFESWLDELDETDEAY
jgi:riboflavin kinase/FMN adenylyltransferase